MDNLQLSELAQKAKNGDISAFEKIYIELSPEIYAIACEITQNKEESRDLVQDCFVAAMENISTLKEPDKIKNWLIRIAANKSRDYIKKKKPSVLTEDQYDIIENLEEDDIAVIPEASLEADERVEDVNEMLQSLTEDKRLCLLLRYKHDMSYAEIANELGISESAVKSRISRAKDDIEKEAEKRKKKGLPLFSVAPFGLVIFALKKSADITAASFAGSAAQTAAFAGITAASQAGIAASATAATAASASASAASTTATAATGIGAKVAAMSVAQKVVAGVAAASIATGSAVGTTVAVKNKIQSETTTATAFVEEYTTAPDYGFESETVFIPSVTETGSSLSEFSTARTSASSEKQSSTVTQTKETEKSTVANKTTTKPTTAKAKTTTQKQTTTKATTTKLQTTTTEEETTTAKVTTTKSNTTEKQTTTTTTKAVTTTKPVTTTTTTKATTTTTEASSPATVTVTVWGEETSTTKTLYFEAGEIITATEIENRLSDEYGIEAIADDINITAEAGGSYTATAYE